MIREYIHHNKDTNNSNFPHGTFAGYRAGCKCFDCNKANNNKKRLAYQNRNIEKEKIDTENKICGECEIKKPNSKFYLIGEYLSPYCKDCEIPRRKKYLYLRAYNLTIEEYEAMIKKQGNRCALSSDHEFKGREPFVDHDHTTNKVRGLLCTKCNFGLGQFNDDIVLLKSAIKYLEENSAADCPPIDGVSSN